MLVVLLFIAAPAAAQLANSDTGATPQPPFSQRPPGVMRPTLGPRGDLACRPGDTRPGCAAASRTVRRAARSTGPSTIVIPPAPIVSDIQGSRLIPPKVRAFLNDPRIDPQTRAFLTYMATKPLNDWTLQELSIVTQLAPTLTEMYVPTQTLSDFYEFLGLDPTQLFEPRLTENWQNQSTTFDARNLSSTEQAFCLQALGLGQNIDPTQVTLGNVAACDNGSSSAP